MEGAHDMCFIDKSSTFGAPSDWHSEDSVGGERSPHAISLPVRLRQLGATDAGIVFTPARHEACPLTRVSYTSGLSLSNVPS